MATRILTDVGLARRLERAEGTANANFVEARARMMPESGAQWIEVAGTYAMFDGPESPCTQTFGLGLFEMPGEADLKRIERFFRERGAPVHHEVCPLADKALLGMLGERGYRPIEWSSVLFQALTERDPAGSTGNITVRLVNEEEVDTWAQTLAEGWGDIVEMPGLSDLMRATATRKGALSFLAELESRPVAAGGLAIHEGIALLAGASTIPEWRHRGAQGALLEARLAYAARVGCELAMIAAEPGSASQRNAERQGFRIAYTRMKWADEVVGD
jgi:GNAT superfamily N-acetyltransferase